MTEQYFLRLREQKWNNFEVMLLAGKKGIKKNADTFVETLRELTSDLNTARANAFDPAIAERLNRLVSDGNHILYRQKSYPLKDISFFIFRTFPAAVRENYKTILACHLIFYGLYIFFAIVCVKNRDITAFMIAPEERQEMTAMYDPDSYNYLKPRSVIFDADMFGYYIFNNVTIAFRAFASGIFAGIGSIGALVFNGVFLGAVTGLIIQAGFSKTFFSFISGHSPFELTGIVLSGAAGLILGLNLFFRKGLSMGAALKRCGGTCSALIGGSAVLITLAAVVEAFWSSRHEIPAMFHYMSGGFFWVLLIVYFVFSGRNKRHAKLSLPKLADTITPSSEQRGIFVLPKSCNSGLIPTVMPQSLGALNPTARIK
ncbi:MAG: stage II sporulation protein M [Termitinemataceae bacterium]|nr:MAG: stage II sporulation protein M [Termitinemataceae bacterium]